MPLGARWELTGVIWPADAAGVKMWERESATKLKRRGGSRVTLPQAPAVGEKITDIPVYRNRGVANCDQLHKSVHHSPIKALG